MLTLAVIAPAGGCGGSEPPPATSPAASPARPAVKPSGTVVPSTGSGDVPDTTLATCRRCQEGLTKGQYAALAQDMDKVAAQRRALRDATVPPSARAVALVCAGAARTNLGQYEKAAENLEAAGKVSAYLPEETRPQLLELMHHAQFLSYTAIGEEDRARRALDRLVETGGDPSRYTAEACALNPGGPGCAPLTPRTTTSTPVPTQTGPTTTEPVPTDTGPTTTEPEPEPEPKPTKDGGEPGQPLPPVET